jgi:putative PIN family toxin of toxin-antitoxin system
MKVLFDTNVVVSAILKDKGPEEIIVFVIEHPEFEWIVSSDILQEYKDVLSRRKFGLSSELLQSWFAVFDEQVKIVDVDLTIDFPRDRKDAKFLACALTENAEFFVTGDRDFTQAQKIINTMILSVSLFKKLVCDVWL